MPTYKHNDYYGYINNIQQKGISNPQWFWSDSEDASQARRWLYNNGASAIVDDIYKNTPEEIQKTIPANYLSQNLQNTRYMNDVRQRNENAGKAVATAAATIAGAPALLSGAVATPIATGLGLIGGTAGSIGGSAIGSRIGNNIYSRGTESDGVGSSISTNRENGATVGGLVGGTVGGIAGASIVKPIANSQLYKGWQLARALNKGVKNTEIADSPVTQNILAGKLGWTPRQNKVIWHNSETPISKLESTFPAWDIVKRDAPLGHVWGTGTETRQGFIGARPFHLRSTKPVEMNKPMVQLNEAVGNGKNAVRNEILKFADQSGADAVNFSNIKDNTLSNQDVYAVFKDVKVKPKLSETERLGIPKGERSNPQALEDPQYWGYQQWNQRYNSAVESGNWDEAQRLRDLHFKTKAPDTKVVDENGNPLHTYHGFLPSRRVFTKFKGVNFDVERTVKEGSKVNHWKLSIPNEYRMTSYHTPNYNRALTPYASGHPDKVYDDYLYIKNPFTWNEENLHNILLNSGHKSEKIPFKEPGHFRKIAARDSNGNRIFKDSDKWIPEKSGFRYPQVSDWADFRGDSKTELMKLGYDGLYIPQYYNSYGAFVSPSQFKSAEPITWNGNGKIIPIVKRDNFRNLDRRYKQGGILKGQNGLMVHPRMILNLRKLIPAKILKNVANVAHNLQFGHEELYPKRNTDGDPGNTFLLDTERQKEELKNLGYVEGSEGDYGLVKNAVNNLIKDTHKSKIPIYQLGNDEATRDTLHVIYNGVYPKNDIPDEGKLIHAGTYPFAIYKGNNSNTYFVKSWDLNDYGKHGDSEGTTYGSRQFLADLYDKIGSPFVQTSGFKQIKDWDGKVVNEESLDFSDETFSETPHIKEQIKNIKNLENEFGKEWAAQAINNIRTLYNNDLLTNRVIPIKPNVK